MKLRNNIIILCTLFLCVGIFISDQSSNKFPFLFFILNLILFFLGFYFLKIKIKKTLSVLFFTSSIFLIIGFTLHHFSKIQVTKGKKHLNKVIECNAIVESSSFTNAGNVKLQLKTVFLNSNNYSQNEGIKFLAYLKNKKIKVNQNDTIYLKSELKSFEFYNNPWEFDFGKFNERKSVIGYVFLNDDNYSLKKGVVFYLDNNSIRSKLNYLLGSVLSGQELEVCKAFLWGEREGVSDEVLNAFSNTGTIHILAVSGLHVGILFAIIIHICKFFSQWINKKQATIISILIAWFYAYITGFSPSILRSVIVFSLIFYNDLTEKRRNELMLMALSAMCLLVYDPNYLFDLGFQLTYAALIGIYVFYPYFKNIYRVKNKVVDYFYSPMMLGFSAQLTTLPIILF
ncbi:MAG: ComEC/Rec2 family competence protein, partial [Crocinitomicaceae bacterium]